MLRCSCFRIHCICNRAPPPEHHRDMPATKQKPAATRRSKAPEPVPPPRLSPLYYRLHGLVHTVRRIGSFEDQLCALLNETKQPGPLSTPAVEELQELLGEIPAWEYQHELQEVRSALAKRGAAAEAKRSQPAAAPAPSRSGAKRQLKGK